MLLDGTGGDEVLGGYPGSYQTVAENLASKRNIRRAVSYWNLWSSYASQGVSARSKGYLQAPPVGFAQGWGRYPSSEHKLSRSFGRYLRDDLFEELLYGID